MNKKVWAISIIAVLLVSGIGLAMAAERIYDPDKGWGEVANTPPKPAPQPEVSESALEEAKEEGTVDLPPIATISVEKRPIRVEVYEGADKESAELVAVLNGTSYVANFGSYAIVSGNSSAYSRSAGQSTWTRVYFPDGITFTDTPNVVLTNEVYPWSARAYYAIDRGWIRTSYFDARITAVDALTDNYIQFFAAGPV